MLITDCYAMKYVCAAQVQRHCLISVSPIVQEKILIEIPASVVWLHWGFFHFPTDWLADYDSHAVRPWLT